jgi:hypothetical protein
MPRCCDDAAGGAMVKTAHGWLCVWCDREADALEGYRQLTIRARPAPTRIPGEGRPSQE